MATETSSSIVGKLPMQVGSSLLLAAGLGFLYWLAPEWDPIGSTTARKAAFFTESMTYVGLFYLLIQASQYMVGRVGSAGGYVLDLFVSAIPLVVLIVIWTAHFMGGPIMSKWVMSVMRVATGFVLADLIIIGALGALRNRLTDELAKQA